MPVSSIQSAPVFIAIAVIVGLLGLNVGLHSQLLTDVVEQHIFINLSLPMLITAVLVGSALAMSSAALQVVLNNPLADPGIIGISSGASLCAGIVIIGGVLPASELIWGLPLACFAGALLSSGLIYLLAKRLALTHSAVILAGIAISTVCAAALAWLYIFGDAQATRNLTFWLMGSFQHASYPILAIAGGILILGIGALCLQRNALNSLYLGDINAQLLGIEPQRLTRVVLVICALLVGVSVSIAGSIAFVGLLVPHILRRIFGSDNRLIIPLSGLVGAALMLVIVTVNQLLNGVDLPISLLTASIGGPIFVWVLFKGQAR
ncbi:MAG: iron chelate uptake ABC transporter family permease subunit [Glaciecola sp.]|nr:iron chelate uptake ABC transporter family permease subunit [Glaciecola sp.]MDG1814529.1 iron chelate uptake ABC transporter family permease subunit [Glaciecola sp.]MDG2099539.1 iron chelate uptake ABC transporter family permease subunit [Glaciecola sp.]